MNPVLATFDTVDQPFPAATVGSYLLTLTLQQPAGDSPQAAPVTVTGTAQIGEKSITIADVPAGTYLGTVALVNGLGVWLADPVADPAPLVIVDVVATVTIPVPSTLTLTRP